MTHQFDTKHAEKYGVFEAILISNISFWITKNIANNRHLRDGKFWTYNSVEAFKAQFPYWTEKQIRRTIDSLISQGVLQVGNFNETAYDRTRWFCFCSESEFIEICPKGQMDLPKKSNGFAQKGGPIPDINTDTYTDINTIGDNFVEKKKKDKGILFSESPLSDVKVFEQTFFVEEFELLNLEYYCKQILDWSESKKARKVDWLAAARGWMRRDMATGRPIMLKKKISNEPKIETEADKW